MNRPRHVELGVSGRSVCADCGNPWPCRVARKRERARRPWTYRYVCALCGPAPAAYARLQHCGLCGFGDEMYRREWRAARGLAATKGAA